jgi:hypothetical protein
MNRGDGAISQCHRRIADCQCILTDTGDCSNPHPATSNKVRTAGSVAAVLIITISAIVTITISAIVAIAITISVIVTITISAIVALTSNIAATLPSLVKVAPLVLRLTAVLTVLSDFFVKLVFCLLNIFFAVAPMVCL